MFIFFLSWVGGCLLFVNVADFNLASAFSLFALLQIGAPHLEGRGVHLQLRVRANRPDVTLRTDTLCPPTVPPARSSTQKKDASHPLSPTKTHLWLTRTRIRDQQIVLRSTWGSLTGTPFYKLNKVFANWSSSRECPYRTGSPDAFRELII